ncbi:DUF4238 domain-containing protein [Stenotrophomonas lacuserhaii]|uniref:DUF4238 domain-containing protein n=1 Tax=Stenotrophomonas lacuserhaii TaxID=2760084 RepID=UPI0032ECE88F
MKGSNPTKPTRRQHTVWRKYLRAWATKEQVWCSMGVVSFRTGLMNVGQEKDFYRVRDMTDQDIALVHAAFVAPMNREIQRRAAERWLTDFNMLSRIRRHLESQGIDAASELEPLYIEIEEKLHGDIERNALPLLERLLAAETFCLDDEDDYIVFVHFLMTQYFRTNRLLANVKRGMGDRFHGTIERSMGALRHIFSTAAGFTLFAERSTMKPRMLLNDTNVPLITGDQPVINALAVDLPVDVAVQDCEFYYPLSPKKALVITASDRFSSGRITDAPQAQEFNRLIAVAAERQIYAASESDLTDVSCLVGQHITKR